MSRGISARRWGRGATPYALGAPAVVWLIALFLIPLVVMLVKALETCSPITQACSMTWHWSEFSYVWHGSAQSIFTSLRFAAYATIVDVLLSFPIAYWIAFYGGRRKNFFLLMLIVPFFVSFVIRTIIWQFLLSSSGIILTVARDLHLVGPNYHVLQTSGAVIAGLAYNYLPFTALPIFVALERIDKNLLDAARDLYSSKVAVFRRVIFPLARPGVFAAFLLTFIPAFGDYVNQQVLGGISNTMVGSVIQNYFLTFSNPTSGSALSAIVMGISLIAIVLGGIAIGARNLGDYV
jgi:spermidine/putrescine transport system permease protein